MPAKMRNKSCEFLILGVTWISAITSQIAIQIRKTISSTSTQGILLIILSGGSHLCPIFSVKEPPERKCKKRPKVRPRERSVRSRIEWRPVRLFPLPFSRHVGPSLKIKRERIPVLQAGPSVERECGKLTRFAISILWANLSTPFHSESGSCQRRFYRNRGWRGQVFGNCLADGWREKGTPGVTNRQDSSSH